MWLGTEVHCSLSITFIGPNESVRIKIVYGRHHRDIHNAGTKDLQCVSAEPHSTETLLCSGFGCVEAKMILRVIIIEVNTDSATASLPTKRKTSACSTRAKSLLS